MGESLKPIVLGLRRGKSLLESSQIPGALPDGLYDDLLCLQGQYRLVSERLQLAESAYRLAAFDVSMARSDLQGYLAEDPALSVSDIEDHSERLKDAGAPLPGLFMSLSRALVDWAGVCSGLAGSFGLEQVLTEGVLMELQGERLDPKFFCHHPSPRNLLV